MTAVASGRARRPLAVLAAGILACLPLTAAQPARAAAAPVSQCTTTQGVILAVDFAAWGGPLLRACGTTPTTGYQLLNEGGWHSQGDNHDGPAFICRISYAGYRGGASFPPPSQDPCVVTPPTSAYWSYWHADPGQNTWSYSHLGSTSYQPKPGGVELWIFGATDLAGTNGSGVPAFSPDSVRAHAVSPPPPAASAPAVSTSGPARAASPQSTDAGSKHGTASPQLGLVAPGASTRSSVAADGSSAPGAGNSPNVVPQIVDAAPTDTAGASATAATISHGSAMPALVALVLVIVLGSAAVVFALRRRKVSDD